VTDLVLIVATVMVLMRHWSVGLVMLATSVFPALVCWACWVGWGLCSTSAPSWPPSVALGVTVDDVLHFMLWFRRGLERGLDRTQAVRLAFDGCARAMYQSWGVIGVGLGVLGLSDFADGPLRPADGLLLSVALVGNLVFLPALSGRPLGKCFAAASTEERTPK